MPDPSLILLLALPILLIWFMSRSAKKQQQKVQQDRNDALVEGNEVETIGGYIGIVVSTDGDTVTLRNIYGELSEWSTRAIRSVYLRSSLEEEDAASDEELAGEEENASAELAGEENEVDSSSSDPEES